MPLQSSGEISIDDIRTEIGTTDGSLRSLSNTAGKTTPDAMSEFYGYSHSSVSSGTLYYSTFSGDDACAFGTGGTYYWSGSGDPVINGYAIYTNSALTSIAAAGWYSSLSKYRLWVTTPSAGWSDSAEDCPAF